ncbi:MAG: hypothetical protein ABW213_09915 [Tardiphaga sp.]
MPGSWTPTLVPDIADDTVYLVVDCSGHGVCAWREAPVGATDLETVIRDMIGGQYDDPLRVVAFNTTEHWSADVSKDIARELRRRVDQQDDVLTPSVEAFVLHQIGRERQLSLRLA